MGTISANSKSKYVNLDEAKKMLDDYYVIAFMSDHGEIHELSSTTGVFGIVSIDTYKQLKAMDNIKEGLVLDPGCYPVWCLFHKDNVDAIDLEIHSTYKNRPDVTIEL